MTHKQLERELKANPGKVIHLAVVNNGSDIINAMMSAGLIEDSISEMEMHDMLMEMYQNGNLQTLKYILKQVPYVPGILPEGYDQIISKRTMNYRNELPETQEQWEQNTGGSLGGSSHGSSDGSFFADMNWGQVFGDFADMFGDIFGEGDTYVMGGGDQSGGYDGPDKTMDGNQIIMYGGIALIAIIVLVVVLKVAK